MLKKMGDVTTAMFSFAMALLWGWMAWYLWDAPVGNATRYGVAVLAVLAFCSGIFSIYRYLIKPMNRAVAETRSGRREGETEEEFVERMLSKLGGEKSGEKAVEPLDNANAVAVSEEDAMVARVLAKLEKQKAEREGGSM